MERRTFLHLCTGAAAASTVAVAVPAWWPSGAWVALDGQALFPGAAFSIEVDAQTPRGCQIALEVAHAGQRWRTLQAADSGTRVAMTTPYPFSRLVPGEYAVEVALIGPDGTERERHVAGRFSLKPFPFST
ncbi:MAG: hypothetical protein EXR79_00590 [Myxococcales bacterium]|nr:hypothetical protein [Myxococcales bacterium]